MAERCAIVGVGQTYHRSKRPDVSWPELAAEAVRAALEDAQLTMKDIDFVVEANMEVTIEDCYVCDMRVIDAIGGVGKSGWKVMCVGTTGGSGACCGFNMASTGLFQNVLVVAFSKLDEMGGAFGRGGTRGTGDIWSRYFPFNPITNFARRSFAYLENAGCSEEAFAITRLKQDQCAMKNPYAHLRLTLTRDQILPDPFLVWPIRRLYMCPTTCGAAAFVVCPEERATTVSNKPVWVEAWEVRHQGGAWTMAENPSVSMLRGGAEALYKRCGITNPAKEVDVWEIYEPASTAELHWMEELMICEPWTAWRLEEQGKVGIDKEIAFNPSGGVTATNPIGGTPVVRVVEAALQIRGDAGEHQVPRPVNRALATGYGGQGENILMMLKKTL